MFLSKLKNISCVLLFLIVCCIYGIVLAQPINNNKVNKQRDKVTIVPTPLDVNKDTSLPAPHLSALAARPWSLMFYTGVTAKQPFGRIIRAQYSSASETLYAMELAYTLHQSNIIRRVLQPIVGTVQIAGNIARRIEHRDAPQGMEYDLYLIFRWINFPWNKYLTTTLAVGEGVSYVSHIPYEELDGITSDDSRRLLNYLMFEATFSLPSHPEWQLLVRLHHRSTAYGIFGNTNGGSNNVGIGIRYYFGFGSI